MIVPVLTQPEIGAHVADGVLELVVVVVVLGGVLELLLELLVVVVLGGGVGNGWKGQPASKIR